MDGWKAVSPLEPKNDSLKRLLNDLGLRHKRLNAMYETLHNQLFQATVSF